MENRPPDPTARADVLVAGGGPAGLTAALLLARAGVSVVLAERRPAASSHPRARGLNVRTMEVMRELVLEGAVRAAGADLARSHLMLFVESLAGRELRRVPDDDLAPAGEALARVTPCGWAMCAQDALEPLLLDAARAAGADVRLGVALESFEQDEEGVSCRLRGPRGEPAEEVLRASYLVACDGARSPVRGRLGLRMAGDGPGSFGSFANILFRADLRALVEGRWFGICFVENPSVEGLLLAVNNSDRWLLNVDRAALPEGLALSERAARAAELVRAAVGVPGLPVEVISVLDWDSAALVAERMRAGRVFLAGDAAHTMPPAGAFGMNTAIQDSHNLAWKLAAVLRGEAAEALLDSYEAERLPVAERVVGRSAREMAADRPDAPVLDEGEGGPPWGEGDPAEAAEAQLRAVLDQRYRSAAVAPDGTGDEAGWPPAGQPGTRAPHVWLERGGVRVSTLDLPAGRFLLLAGPEGEGWAAAGRAAGWLAALRVGVDVGDPAGAWAGAFGVGLAGAALIRPDGYVAWRSPVPADDSEAALRDLRRQILGVS